MGKWGLSLRYSQSFANLCSFSNAMDLLMAIVEKVGGGRNEDESPRGEDFSTGFEEVEEELLDD